MHGKSWEYTGIKWYTALRDVIRGYARHVRLAFWERGGNTSGDREYTGIMCYRHLQGSMSGEGRLRHSGGNFGQEKHEADKEREGFLMERGEVQLRRNKEGAGQRSCPDHARSQTEFGNDPTAVIHPYSAPFILIPLHNGLFPALLLVPARH